MEFQSIHLHPPLISLGNVSYDTPSGYQFSHEQPQILVGMEGFEPTQPEAPDLQSGVTLQLHRIPIKLFYIF